MTIKTLLAVVLAIALSGAPAPAQPVSPGSTCTGQAGVDWDQQIESCTAIIESPQENRHATAPSPSRTAATPGTPGATSTAPSPTTTRRSGSIRNMRLPTSAAAVAYLRQGRLRPRHRGLRRGDPARSEKCHTPTTTAATLYGDKGDYDRAIADYDEAIRLDPRYAVAYYNRGVAYCDKGDYDRAIADYNEAIRLDPKLCPHLHQPRPRLLASRATTTAPSPTSTRRSAQPERRRGVLSRGLA